MRSIRMLFLAAILVGIASLVTPEQQASAATFKSGEDVEILKAQTINDDLYFTGGTLTISGRVTGDVIAVAGKVVVSGQVEGNLQAIAGTIEITGDVGGSVRAAGGKVTIAGDVGRDVILASGSMTIESAGAVDGDLLMAGGDVDLRGPVSGEVRGTANSLTIDSRIGGNVDVTVGDIALLSKARLAKDFSYNSTNPISMTAGATVAGKTTKSERKTYTVGTDLTGFLSSPLFRLLCLLIAGLIMVLLVPGAAASVADAARLAPLTSVIIGLMLLVGVPIVLVITLLTLVGIPIAFIGFIIYFCLLYLSQVFVGLALGRLILPKSWDVRSRGYNLLAMTLGVIIIGAIRMAPLPWVGAAVGALCAIVALGAVAVAIRAARRPAIYTTA